MAPTPLQPLHKAHPLSNPLHWLKRAFLDLHTLSMSRVWVCVFARVPDCAMSSCFSKSAGNCTQIVCANEMKAVLCDVASLHSCTIHPESHAALPTLQEFHRTNGVRIGLKKKKKIIIFLRFLVLRMHKIQAC